MVEGFLMQHRNAKYTETGNIDCEVNHPLLGWIPFTASPDDSEQYGQNIFSAIVQSEGVAPYTPPDPAQQLAAERAAMTATRGQFLIAAVGAGIITEATAEEAAGGGWPAAFDTFMAGLSAPQRIAAKAAWVDGDKVRRTNPILALIAADQSVSPEAVDDLFRAAMAIEL